MELPIKNLNGQEIGIMQVSDSIFAVPFKRALVHQVMVGHLANRRVGTASTRTRGEVRGGGRKPLIQKHTGKARQGSIRSPQWRHGGVVFGPHPRDYHQKTPRKMRQGAIRCLLAQRFREGQITIVEEIPIPSRKTKDMIRILESLGIRSKSLVVSENPSQDLRWSCRNIGTIKSLQAANIGTMDLLEYSHLLITVSAVRKIEKLWGHTTKHVIQSQTGQDPDQKEGA